MAKFLNTSATNYFLEELIKNASDRLVLISPFLKLNDRIKELLEDKNRLKIDVRIVYGKNELQPDEINWLKELTFVRTSFCKNLHAKCYLNELGCIVTSLNLYEFSQVNNNEMGIYISRDEDPEIYRETYEEAQRIIRISDEIRISLEKVAGAKRAKDDIGSRSVKPGTNQENTSATKQVDTASSSETGAKLSTSRIAVKRKLKTQEFLDKALQNGWLSADGEGHALTEAGLAIGGELKSSPRYGDYFVWPEDVEI